MGVSWTRVKEVTLWTYEEILAKLNSTLSYDFVSKHYDLKLRKVQTFLMDLLKREDKKYDTYRDNVVDTLRQAEVFGVGNLSGLLRSIPNREQCEYFIQTTNIEFEKLIQLLNCMLRWILPFSRPIREFIDKGHTEQEAHLSKTRPLGIRYNLDVLDRFRTRFARVDFASEADIPMNFMTNLMHRCDLSRLPYVSGSTVSILFHSGFTTLDAVANTSLERLERKVQEYLEGIGKRYSRSFIELESAIVQATVLPKIIEA
ncbi:MAG: DUF4332 domain-containing protein [Candidatus Thorarchaeota archaeon]